MHIELPDINDRIEQVAQQMLRAAEEGTEQLIHCPLVHRFAPHVYLREIHMPKGAKIVGEQHQTEHFNIVLQGCAKVFTGSEVAIIRAPYTFTSKPGIRKMLHIMEDMIWQTVHAMPDADPEAIRSRFESGEIEQMLIVKSAASIQYQASLFPASLDHPNAA